MATSISPVATIWQSAPTKSHGQNAADGDGRWSPVAISTTTKKITENGKPNRKRILVAPQVPSGPVNCRCIALRATCPSAAMMVKGIQSVAMLIMCGDAVERAGNGGHRAGAGERGQPKRCMTGLQSAPSPRLRGRDERSSLLEGWGEGLYPQNGCRLMDRY